MPGEIPSSQVLPLAAEASEALYEAVRYGVGYADSLQPDPDIVDSHFWSHSARFLARNHLRNLQGETWSLRERVSNSGIHLVLGQVHVVRVVKSLSRTIPHPGRNRTRRAAWVGVPQSQQLQFALPMAGGEGPLPPLSLIADWHLDEDREPRIFLSLPKGPWKYRQNPRVHWRVPLAAGGSPAISDLPDFNGGDPGDPTIWVDPSEWAAGE